ncbi:thioesterase domain-containing protein [Streptomyces incanus]
MNEERLRALPESKRALFEDLRARRSRAGQPHANAAAGVEQLRRGTGTPVVLVHPVGGELFCYGELTRRLPAGFPVYGLSADHMLRAPEPPELTALARHYVDRLTRAGIRPALVVGWSFGGMVAYEMVRLLSRGGRPCRVVLIDSMPFSASGPEAETDLLRAGLLRRFVSDLRQSGGARPEGLGTGDEAWSLPPEEALRALHGRLVAQLGAAGMSLDELRARLRVYANASLCLRRHHPAPGGPPLRLLWAGETAGDLSAWWRDTAPSPITGERVAGDHYSLLRPPAVEDVARFVHEALEEEQHGD